MKLPQKTIHRLSKYRRLLLKYQYLDDPYIFSHDLARLLDINPVQVRRDLMLIKSSGNHRKGYNVIELIDAIGNVLDTNIRQKVAIIGMGKLGQAIIQYLEREEMHMRVVAGFDVDPMKIGKEFEGVNVFDMRYLVGVIHEKKIKIGVLAVPTEDAQNISNILVSSGVKGILNFTSRKIDAPSHIYIRDFDIITALEELAYHINHK